LRLDAIAFVSYIYMAIQTLADFHQVPGVGYVSMPF